MSSAHTIRRSDEFRRVLDAGERRSGRLVVAYVQVSDGPTRAGFVCGRSVGGAVERNRARRLLREAWRSLLPSVRSGLDVVVVARPEIRGVRLADVESDVRAVLRAGGVIES
jgi:ribonuclease P protein component